MISGGPAYALFLKTNARGPAHAPFLNKEARSVYFSPRDGCPLGGWAWRPLLSLETKGNTVTAPPVSPPFLNAVARLQRAHTNSLHSRMRQIRASAARQFMRACYNNNMWWPSVRAFLKYECTGPGARSVCVPGWLGPASFLSLNCGGRQESGKSGGRGGAENAISY